MKRAFRETVIEAHRLHAKNLSFPEIAKKLKLDHVEQIYGFVKAGELIVKAESYRLTDNEMAVMGALVTAEIRAIETDSWPPKTSSINFALKKGSGWCSTVINKRLRMAYDDEAGPHEHRLNLVFHVPISARGTAGSVWMTAAGWAFAWEVGLILANWKVPA
jgi:hypothetical protein